LQLKIRLKGDADGTLAGMTIRSCLHADAYNPNGDDNLCAITEYAFDGANQGFNLEAAIKPIAATAVANIDGGPGAYTAIKDAWDAIPSIPFVFDKDSMGVNWMTIEENIAHAFSCTLRHFMEQYEFKQRASKTGAGMSAEEKKVFVDKVGDAAFPYACQADQFVADQLCPDVPEFKTPPYSIDLGKIFGVETGVSIQAPIPM